jgi:DNA-binding transcriptional MocR family regulator
MLMPSPLMVALVTHWVKTGIADKIIDAIRNEAMGRQQLARSILKGVPYAARPAGHHLWLSLPARWNRTEFLSHLLRHGLAVVGGDAFSVGDPGAQAQGVRVSLGAARNRAELAQALQFLSDTVNFPVRNNPIV